MFGYCFTQSVNFQISVIIVLVLKVLGRAPASRDAYIEFPPLTTMLNHFCKFDYYFNCNVFIVSTKVLCIYVSNT